MREITITARSFMDLGELERLICGTGERGASPDQGRCVRLVGEFNLVPEAGRLFRTAEGMVRNLVTIDRPNITLDAAAAVIRVVCARPIEQTLNVFYLTGEAAGTQFLGLHAELLCRTPDAGAICLVQSNAQGLRLRDCRLKLAGCPKGGMTAVRNCGNLDTPLATRADCLSMSGCTVQVEHLGEDGLTDSQNCGVANVLANSCVMENCFVSVSNAGGAGRTATGVFNSGRFFRLSNCNVKANGSHAEGRLLEKPRAVAVHNRGAYALISDSNLVAEWGGTCIGLQNAGDHVRAGGNKILATHTVKGRCTYNEGSFCVFSGNVMTSTSRNPRLFDCRNAVGVTVTDNVLHALCDAQSGAGLCFAACEQCIVRCNQIRGAADCGIYRENSSLVEGDNVIEGFAGKPFRRIADPSDAVVSDRIKEENIRSL